jgi:superfamily I DNA and RNA helicase
MFRSFSSPAEQDNWVADEIQKNLDEDEIDHDDILIVLPDAVRAKRRASQIRSALARRGIDSHLAGVDTSADEVFIEGSVALANIYRAKGNEAPMVYALDSQYAAGSDNAVSRRNTIFTAITRSRAWVRVCGWGEESRVIAEEFARVTEKQFRLDFRIPTAPELEQIRRIHRERSADEVATLKRATEALTEVIEAFDRDEFNFDELPPAIRTKLADLIDQAASNGNDTTHDSD